MARPDASLRLAVGLTLIAVAGACSVSLPVRPAAPSIEKIGVVTGVTDSQARTTYTFADGSAWDRPNDQYRVIYDLMGRQTLLGDGNLFRLVPALCAFSAPRDECARVGG